MGLILLYVACAIVFVTMKYKCGLSKCPEQTQLQPQSIITKTTNLQSQQQEEGSLEKFYKGVG